MKDTTPKPAVLVFGGSEGGISTDDLAAMIASNGYPALALAYWKEPGLPTQLANIPLEYFADAGRVLASEPSVDPAHILVYGDSRGSEAALLLGVDYPQLFHGVIVGSPSSVVNPGYPTATSPAWTFQGRPVPGVPILDFGNPNPIDAPEAVIPVEKIDGPVLTICGQADALWPSCAYAAAITQRLAQHHFGFTHEALSYPDAGHFVGALRSYAPLPQSGTTGTGQSVQSGGSAYATEQAAADAWAKWIDFLAAQ